VPDLLAGYGRASTEEQDRTAEREAQIALGVSAERIYVDRGLTGTNRDGPGGPRGAGRLPRRRHAVRDQSRPAPLVAA
jgi:hypothetical protein